MMNGEQARGVPTVTIAEVIGRSISEDGTTAMITARTSTGETIGIAMPATNVRTFRAVASALVESVDRRGLSHGHVLLKRPQFFEVGHSDEMRGMVALQFDPRTADEQAFLLSNQNGLELAKAVRADILPRLSEAERASMIASESKLAVPTRRILRPGEA